jgi:hypothetical protein
LGLTDVFDDVEAQGGADLVGVQLGDGALVSLVGFPGTRAQPSGHNRAIAFVQALGDVFGGLAPDVDGG